MFEKEETKQPTTVGNIVVRLVDLTSPDEGRGAWLRDDDGMPRAGKGAYFEIMVVDQHGEEMRIAVGDLLPHLSQAQIKALDDFMVSLRRQAEEQIL